MKQRKLLIDLVEDGNSIASSAKEIGIKHSTAKRIMKKFRETAALQSSRRTKNPCSRP